MTCTFGKRSNRRTQREDVVVPDREPLALHELHDGAALEIDRGNQHERRHESRRHEARKCSCS